MANFVSTEMSRFSQSKKKHFLKQLMNQKMTRRVKSNARKKTKISCVNNGQLRSRFPPYERMLLSNLGAGGNVVLNQLLVKILVQIVA